MINFVPVKVEELALPSTMPIGTTFIAMYGGEQHIILKQYGGYVSLTDPGLVWGGYTAFDTSDGLSGLIKYVNIEAKIID